MDDIEDSMDVKEILKREKEIIHFIQKKGIKESNDLKIEKVIAKGGYAIVYKGIKNDGKLYAIKVVLDNNLRPSEVLSGYELIHENINTMRKFYQCLPGFSALIYDFIDGQDLQIHMVNYGIFQEKHAKMIFKQMLNALSFCHDKGIYHRDIKMENIIIYDYIKIDENRVTYNEKTKIKLIDFGFAFFSECPLLNGKYKEEYIIKNYARGYKKYIPIYHKDILTEQWKYVGTDSYCSPEIILAAIEVEEDIPPTDIYSLGVVLYIMITGTFPREKTGFIDFLKQTRELFFKNNEDDNNIRELFKNIDFCKQLLLFSDLEIKNIKIPMSLQLKDLLTKMLHPLPDYRITIEEIMQHPWLL